ncbi:25346_t:CDS:2 [Gigaspora rosea]|nr:25346_t:CDS:2 [Gigaspora rosea]
MFCFQDELAVSLDFIQELKIARTQKLKVNDQVEEHSSVPDNFINIY